MVTYNTFFNAIFLLSILDLGILNVKFRLECVCLFVRLTPSPWHVNSTFSPACYVVWSVMFLPYLALWFRNVFEGFPSSFVSYFILQFWRTNFHTFKIPVKQRLTLEWYSAVQNSSLQIVCVKLINKYLILSWLMPLIIIDNAIYLAENGNDGDESENENEHNPRRKVKR